MSFLLIYYLYSKYQQAGLRPKSLVLKIDIIKQNKNFYLMILKFSLEIIFSIALFGEGKSILLSKKITPRITTKTKTSLIINPRKVLLELVFLINCI